MNSNINRSRSAFSFFHFFFSGACELFTYTLRSFCALTKGNVDYVLIFLIDEATKTLPRPFSFLLAGKIAWLLTK